MPESESELPWLQAPWQSYAARIAQARVPHALLITGPAGSGKSTFAAQVANSLLCEQREADAAACGTCRGCRLGEQRAHPDFFVVTPEEGRQSIRVDQIRALTDSLSLKSQYAGYRVGLIDPADAMNTAAANSLLKTLEEPTPGAVLVLAATFSHRLPATIRSRCQQLALPLPSKPQALAWLEARGASVDLLEVAGGSPLRAVALTEAGWGERLKELLAVLSALAQGRVGVVEAAQSWLESGSRILVPLLLAIVVELIRLRTLGASSAGYRDADRLQGLADGLDLMALHNYLDRLLEARRHLEHPLNDQLLVEELFIGWSRVARTRA